MQASVLRVRHLSVMSEHVSVLACIFGQIHCRISHLDQIIDIIGMFGIGGNADARAYIATVSVELNRFIDGLDDVLCDI